MKVEAHLNPVSLMWAVGASSEFQVSVKKLFYSYSHMILSATMSFASRQLGFPVHKIN